MKTNPRNKCTWCFIAIVVSFILISCERNDDTGLSIQFSDGTVIHEENITFYDSSTCILFLKEELSILVGTGEPPTSSTEFSVFINNDLLFQGVIYPDFNFCSAPPMDPWISSKTYPILESKILPIKGSRDIINDRRFIMGLEESNLLKHGIKCRIDNAKISSDNDTTVICTFTYKNYDQLKDVFLKTIIHESNRIIKENGYLIINSKNYKTMQIASDIESISELSGLFKIGTYQIRMPNKEYHIKAGSTWHTEPVYIFQKK